MEIAEENALPRLQSWRDRAARLGRWQGRGLLALFGAVGALGLPPFSLPILYACSLSGLFVRTYLAEHQSWKSTAFDFWAYGFGFFVASLYWIGNSLLVDAETFGWLLPFAAILMPTGLALFFAIAGFVFHSLRRWLGTSLLLSLITFVLSISGGEWLRGHVLTGFPWNLPGYIWSDLLIFAQSAFWLGIYGLSVLTLFWACLPAVSLLYGWRRKAGMVSIVAFLLIPTFMAVVGASRLEQHPTEFEDSVSLRLVQPNVRQAEKWLPERRLDHFQNLLALTGQEGLATVTHIIWPETATPFLLDRQQDAQEMIAAVLGPERILITGYPRFEFDRGENRFYNSVGSLSQSNGLQHNYDKRHLVPFGEYLPLAKWLSALGLKKLTAGREGYASGSGPVVFDVEGLPRIRSLICYEIIFPEEILSNSEDTPRVLLNLTNDAWFGDSTGPYQHLAITRMRAIETGIPVLRIANTGISAVIDPLGRIIQSLKLNESGVIDSKLPRPLVYSSSD